MIAPVTVSSRDTTTRSRVALGPLLVASDGRTTSNPAVHFARFLAERANALVSVVSVLEPLPVGIGELALAPPPPELEQARREQLFDAVDEQMRAAGVEPDAWTREIVRGAAAPTIARQAESGRASYIVMGLGRHGLVDRLLGSETALRVLRLADAPVLAVAPGCLSLPRRVIVALDFSPASIRAARAALPLLAPDATVYLVHVEPRVDLPPGDWASWEMSREGGIASAFEQAIAEIGIADAMCVETITLRGDPGKELLDLARASRAELIVVGSHGHGFVERMLLGSVATKVIRGACCSVLAVPPMRDELVGGWSDAGEMPVERIPRESWATSLAAFTRRNLRRACQLEEVGPDVGAQHEIERGELVGASHDRHDGRVTVMLATAGGHLTRSISHPTQLYLMRGTDFRDAMLRVAHDDGQTLLALVD